MKSFNLTLEIPKNFQMTQYNCWEHFIIRGANTIYKDGIDIKTSRRINKILDLIEKSNGSVELEDADFEIVKNIVDRGKFDAQLRLVVEQIAKSVEDAK